MVETVLALLREDWLVIRRSPRPFILALVLGIAVGGWGVSQLRSERASIQSERIALLEGQLRRERQPGDDTGTTSDQRQTRATPFGGDRSEYITFTGNELR